jgi:hypothetical protein
LQELVVDALLDVDAGAGAAGLAVVPAAMREGQVSDGMKKREEDKKGSR